MASHTMLLLAVLCVSAATPLAHGLIINGITITNITITGLLVCSETGNVDPSCSSCSGVPGALVQLSCMGGQTTLGQALTNLTGFYKIALGTVDSLLFDASDCKVVIPLPVVGTSCALLPPTGNLQTTVTLVGVVQTLLSAIANFVAGHLTWVHWLTTIISLVFKLLHSVYGLFGFLEKVCVFLGLDLHDVVSLQEVTARYDLGVICKM